MNKKALKNKKFLIFFSFAIFFDQISKFLVNYLGLENTINRGISFSWLSDASPQILTIITLVLLVVVFFVFQKDWRERPFSSGVFFGGAFSNIFDRLVYGGVHDWLNVPFFELQNNLADWFIFLGIATFIFSSLKKPRV